MIPLRLGGVDNRAKDGAFVDQLQDENSLLRREIRRLREELLAMEARTLTEWLPR